MKNLKSIDLVLIFFFFFFFACFLFSVKSHFNNSDLYSPSVIRSFPQDEFDSSLGRLNTMNKLSFYCDSLYKADFPSHDYPEIVSQTLRKRFYHGYSYYNRENNLLGVLLEPLVHRGVTAVVIADDIVKYSYAACSQQSIVGMEVFKSKGYKVRKISMFDTVSNMGHFAYEVFYGNGWHYFDTDEEPDAKILAQYGRPSAAFLAANPSIVLAAYSKRTDPQHFKRLIISAKTGPVNKFPAPHAYMYQIVTKYFTFFGWCFFLLIIIVRYSIRKRKNRKATPASKKGPASSVLT